MIQMTTLSDLDMTGIHLGVGGGSLTSWMKKIVAVLESTCCNTVANSPDHFYEV